MQVNLIHKTDKRSLHKVCGCYTRGFTKIKLLDTSHIQRPISTYVCMINTYTIIDSHKAPLNLDFQFLEIIGRQNLPKTLLAQLLRSVIFIPLVMLA